MVILVGMVAGCLVSLICDQDSFMLQEQQDDNNEQEEDANYLTGDVVDSLLSFSPTTFFVILLPPIIFNSGYHIQKDLFFRHMTPICLYACVGTAVCTVAVAALLHAVQGFFSFQATFLELLAFGALISATDPVSTLAVFSSKKVDPHLFYLVFGESMINDAVGLVLFTALAHLVEQQQASGGDVAVGQEVAQFLLDFTMGFLGSLCLGTVFALVFAYFLKIVDFRHTPLFELCLYVTIMYFPFVVAEICHLSGIVTVLFTGIAAKRYAEPNLSSNTASNADTVFRLTAHLTETIIFLELGLSVFGLLGSGAFHAGFVACSLGACLVGRAINIYPITALYNCCVGRRQAKTAATRPDESVLENGQQGLVMEQQAIDDTKVPWSMAHMLWFSGLRGAVSYALVRTFPSTGNEPIFVVTTMLIVLVTTFVFGGSTEWALDKLQIPVGVDDQQYLQSLRKRQLLVGWLSQWERTTLRSWVIRDFDARHGKEATSTSPSKMTIGHSHTADTSSSEEDLADDEYSLSSDYQHFELTEQEHLENVVDTSATTNDDMAAAPSSPYSAASPEQHRLKKKKKKRTKKFGIFDFGQ